MNFRALSVVWLWLMPALMVVWVSSALAQSSQPLPAAPGTALKTEAPAADEPSAAVASPLPAGIEKAFEKALDRKLAPIMRTLAEMQEQKVRLTDVLGGLGYIFGLVGVAAYYKRRP
jgi:nickel transport protein